MCQHCVPLFSQLLVPISLSLQVELTVFDVIEVVMRKVVILSCKCKDVPRYDGVEHQIVIRNGNALSWRLLLAYDAFLSRTGDSSFTSFCQAKT